MNNCRYNISKYSLLLAFSLATAGCVSTTLIDPKPSAPLKVVQQEYTPVYERREFDTLKIEFISEENTLAISDIKKTVILHLGDNQIIKKLFANSDASVIYGQASLTNNRYLFSTSNGLSKIWDTKNWLLLREFNGKISRSTNGLSSNGTVLYFGNKLMSTETGEELVSFGSDPRFDSHDFSKDGHYFIAAGYHFGTVLINIPLKKNIVAKTRISDVSQLRFRRDNHFYASYDARLSVVLGGYYPKKLGLFSHTTNEIITRVTPLARIACWTTTKDDEVLMALVNGDVILLNSQLEPLNKWNLGDKVNVCKSGQKGQVWLGTEKTGIYRIDLINKTLSNPVKTKRSIFALDISSDEKYLGLVESIPGASVVKVYQIHDSR